MTASQILIPFKMHRQQRIHYNTLHRFYATLHFAPIPFLPGRGCGWRCGWEIPGSLFTVLKVIWWGFVLNFSAPSAEFWIRRIFSEIRAGTAVMGGYADVSNLWYLASNIFFKFSGMTVSGCGPALLDRNQRRRRRKIAPSSGSNTAAAQLGVSPKGTCEWLHFDLGRRGEDRHR